MPSRVRIRRAHPDDWPACKRVRLAALEEAPYAFGSTLERELAFADRLWRQRLESASAASFLAWLGTEPVGMAVGLADDPGDEFAVPGAWQLVGMWADPRVRGLGVAGPLVEVVAAHARAQGAASLVLWVTEVNDRARSFYRRMGFTGTGMRQLVRPEQPDHWEEQMIRYFG